MSSPNEDQKPMDNMEPLGPQASACGSGCDCHTAGPLGRMRWVLGAIVLLAAAGLVARAVVKSHGAPTEPTVTGFVSSVPATTPDSQLPTPSGEAAEATEASVGTSIASLSDLNTVAVANDAVFVYVPGRDGPSGNPPSAAMRDTAGRMAAQGHKIGLFTLETGSRDYEQLAAQMSMPGVLAIVKGRGMSVVSGEITETKLIQGFVAAGNCGPAGCCPPPGSK